MQLRYFYFPLLFIFLILPSMSQARLDESREESLRRYGKIVNNPPPNVSRPLIQGASYITHQHNGWQIQSAFINGVSVRMRYTKLPRKGSSQVLHLDEITTL